MKLRKTLVSALVFVLILCSLAGAFSVSAAGAYSERVGGEETLRAEETVWRYRVYNGVYQRRLWSITRLIWLTDWMPL